MESVPVEVVNPKNPLSGHAIKFNGGMQRFKSGANGGVLIGAKMRGTGVAMNQEEVGSLGTAGHRSKQIRENPRSAEDRAYARQAEQAMKLNHCQVEFDNMNKCFTTQIGNVSLCQSYADALAQCKTTNGIEATAEMPRYYVDTHKMARGAYNG